MAKIKYTTDWYHLDRILQYDVPNRMIIGMRSNGKTYSVKERIINRLAEEDNFQFVYLRRDHKQVVRDEMDKLFSDINEYSMKKLGDTISYNTKNGFYLTNDKAKKTIGYAIALEDAEDIRGHSFPLVKLILFDEFMSKTGYRNEEFDIYLNVLSTIRRKRNDVEVFMVANTISKYCPYFEKYKIEVKNLKQGYITYVKHKNGFECAIEYCRTLIEIDENGNRVKDKYLGIDDCNEISMIVDGKWETMNLTTHEIDGIKWNYKDRVLIPAVFSGFGYTFELSYAKTKFPICFVRKINTQDGKVNEAFKFNIALDEMSLTNKNGAVPRFGAINEMMGDGMLELLHMFDNCLRCGRVLYTNVEDGTEFLTIYNEIIKR